MPWQVGAQNGLLQLRLHRTSPERKAIQEQTQSVCAERLKCFIIAKCHIFHLLLKSLVEGFFETLSTYSVDILQAFNINRTEFLTSFPDRVILTNFRLSESNKKCNYEIKKSVSTVNIIICVFSNNVI